MFTDDSRYKSFCEKFEKSGESGIRVGILTGEFKLTPLKHESAIEWCRLRDKASMAKIRRDVHIDRYIAITAVIIAAIAAHKEIKSIGSFVIAWLSQ